MGHVLVTGAAGFIGSHLVEDLLRSGFRVTGLDNFDDFYPRAVKEDNLKSALSHPCFRLIEGDICDFRALCTWLTDDYDCIVHLAAKAGVRPSIARPDTYAMVNIVGTQTMLEFARVKGVRQFVFGSSSSVYGTNPHVPWREDDTILRPISPYAATKAAAELLGHVYSHVHGIRFVALRFFTVYGPRQRPDLAIHKFTELLLEGRAIPIFGDGSTSRDYTFVSDIVAGVRKAMDYQGSAYEVINIAGGQPVALLALIHALEVELGVEAQISFQPEQPGDVSQTFADVEKAAEFLSYRSATSLRQGLREFLKWYLCDRAPRVEVGQQSAFDNAIVSPPVSLVSEDAC